MLFDTALQLFVPHLSTLLQPLSVLCLLFCIRYPRPPKADPLIKKDGLPSPTECAVTPNGSIGGSSSPVLSQLHIMETKMTHIERTLKKLLEVMSRPPRKGPIDASRWRALAAVLDRLFLALQCILIIITITLLFPRETYWIVHILYHTVKCVDSRAIRKSAVTKIVLWQKKCYKSNWQIVAISPMSG